MSRWATTPSGRAYPLKNPRRETGGALRKLYNDMNYMTAAEAQAAVARGPSPTAEWERMERSAVEATKKQFERENRVPELSYEEEREREQAAQAAAEREELSRAAQAAHRHRADLDHAENVARLVQRKSELEAVKAFEEKHIHAPRKLARFVRGR